jgi:hypothetical protein
VEIKHNIKLGLNMQADVIQSFLQAMREHESPNVFDLTIHNRSKRQIQFLIRVGHVVTQEHINFAWEHGLLSAYSVLTTSLVAQECYPSLLND